MEEAFFGPFQPNIVGFFAEKKSCLKRIALFLLATVPAHQTRSQIPRDDHATRASQSRDRSVLSYLPDPPDPFPQPQAGDRATLLLDTSIPHERYPKDRHQELACLEQTPSRKGRRAREVTSGRR
jgi:hypothetical protein